MKSFWKIKLDLKIKALLVLVSLPCLFLSCAQKNIPSHKQPNPSNPQNPVSELNKGSSGNKVEKTISEKNDEEQIVHENSAKNLSWKKNRKYVNPETSLPKSPTVQTTTVLESKAGSSSRESILKSGSNEETQDKPKSTIDSDFLLSLESQPSQEENLKKNKQTKISDSPKSKQLKNDSGYKNQKEGKSIASSKNPIQEESEETNLKSSRTREDFKLEDASAGNEVNELIDSQAYSKDKVYLKTQDSFFEELETNNSHEKPKIEIARDKQRKVSNSNNHTIERNFKEPVIQDYNHDERLTSSSIQPKGVPKSYDRIRKLLSPVPTSDFEKNDRGNDEGDFDKIKNWNAGRGESWKNNYERINGQRYAEVLRWIQQKGKTFPSKIE